MIGWQGFTKDRTCHTTIATCFLILNAFLVLVVLDAATNELPGDRFYALMVLRGCVERSVWRQFANHDAYGSDIDHGL